MYLGRRGCIAPDNGHGILFDRDEREKQARLDAVADQINERFGVGALGRGNRGKIRLD
jgi:hypothetical protein